MKKVQTKKKFPHIAKVIRENRNALGVLSQEKLSRAIGYNGGQFISNVERGLCSIPEDKVKVVADCLQINPTIIIDAMLEDRRKHLMDYL